MVDEEAAEQRADDGRDPEDCTEVALVLAAFSRRDDVAHNRERDHHEPAGAEPLQGAEADQLRHRLREAAERRSDQEDHDRGLQHTFAAVEVAELPVERPGDGRGEEIGGDHPREVGDSAEVADDRRERRRDDRLIERRQEQHQHQRAEDRANARRGLESGVRHLGDTTNKMKLLRCVTITAR